MACTLQFVDSVATSPTVRLDLSDDSKWTVLRPGTDFSPPPLKRSVASTLLQDGGAIPAAAYDLRTITLELALGTTTADGTASALQDLYQELDRPGGNILLWQEHTTNPIFFRTFRTSASSVRRLGFADGKRKRIQVEIPAEPFGYGIEETLTDVTVDNDPAGATNPNYFDVSSVKGDVEAPMRIKKQQTGSTVAAPFVFLTAARRRGTVANVPYLLQAEAMTQATDTSIQANDTGMSGAGSNYSQCDFSTDATMARRLRVDEWPSSPSTDARGTYRVFGRFRKPTSSDEIRVQLRVGGPQAGGFGTSPSILLPEVTLSDLTSPQHMDLGLVQIPVGTGARFNGPSGEELPAEGPRVELWAARDSGTGNLDIDYLIWVPADDRLAIVESTAGWDVSADSGVVMDSYADLLYAHRDTGDAVVNSAVGQVTGSLPMLSPGVTNRIWYIDAVGPAVIHLISVSRTFELSYWPRYLSIRPAST